MNLRLGPKGQAATALLLYAVAAVALFATPVLSRFSSVYLGRGGSDQNLFAWSLVWWPNAILNGRNPFHADVLWAPEGVNLAWVTGIPGPSLLMAPVTSALGPVASLNLLLLASPVLADWSAYLVCRRITGEFWPAVAGGYVFGFSTYVAAKTQGHLNLALVFLVPLALYLVLRRLDGAIGRLRFVLLLTTILVGQFSISTEVFATMTVFGAIALAGGYAFGSSSTRVGLVRIAPLVLAAYLGAMIIVGPYLYYALTDIPPAPIRDLEKASADLLSFAVPGRTTALGGETYRHITSDFTAPRAGRPATSASRSSPCWCSSPRGAGGSGIPGASSRSSRVPPSPLSGRRSTCGDAPSCRSRGRPSKAFPSSTIRSPTASRCT